MTPMIDKTKTGQRIRQLMEYRGLTVKDVQTALSLGCVQSIYHWLDGQSLPTLDNIYALSELFKVPVDLMICGNRQYNPSISMYTVAERLFCYYGLFGKCQVA